MNNTAPGSKFLQWFVTAFKNLHRLLLDYYSIQFKHRFNPIEFEWTDSFVLIDLQVFALPSELLHRMHVTVVRMRVTIVHPMEK
ncbi:hypothetical protein ACSQ67_000427 [Phaseolus vulgaris]